MIKGYSGINYKEGKYFFGGVRKRDVILYVIYIVIAAIVVMKVPSPYPDDALYLLKAAVIIGTIFLILLLPSNIYKSNYMLIYYYAKWYLNHKRYVWKGVEYNFVQKEEND